MLSIHFREHFPSSDKKHSAGHRTSDIRSSQRNKKAPDFSSAFILPELKQLGWTSIQRKLD